MYRRPVPESGSLPLFWQKRDSESGHKEKVSHHFHGKSLHWGVCSIPRQMGSERPRVWASGSLAARCGIPASQTRHSGSIRAGFLPLSIHHRDSGTRTGKNRTSPTVGGGFSAAVHSIGGTRSSSVKIPISVLPPNFLTDLS